MNRIFFPLALTLAIAVLVAIPFRSTPAQNVLTKHCLEQVERTDPSSIEHLFAKFRLTGALRRQDLPQALNNAKEAVELARAIADPDYVNVANASVDLIQRMIDLSPTDDVDLHLTSIGPHRSELQLHLTLAQIEAELWIGKSSANFAHLLKVYENSVNESTDPYLSIQQEALDLYVRVYRLDESPNSTEIIEKRKHVLAESVRLDYRSGVVVALLVESSGLTSQKTPNQQIDVIEEALNVANAGNDKILTIRCNVARGMASQSRRQWDEARPYYVKSIKLADALGSQPLAMKILIDSMFLEQRSGQPEAARQFQERIESHPGYERLAPIWRNALNRVAVWTLQQMNEPKQAEKYKNAVFSSDAVGAIRNLQNEIKNKSDKNLQTQDKLTESESDKRQLIQEQLQTKDSHDRATAEIEKIVVFFRRYSLFATLLVFFMFPWFVLFLFRSRLKSVSQALDSERETSQRSQTKCDELAVRLNRLQRMESLGLMAGSVAHDFNNILVGVMGNAEVIQLRQNTEPESTNDEFVKQRVSSIIKSAEKAASLSRQMLAYAGKQYIARRSTDLNEVIRQFESVLRSTCQENQELKLDLSRYPVVSKVDVTQIEQVVLNLITNAVEASSDNGRITITTGFHTVDDIEDDCSLYGTRATGGDFCFIEVADSGSGISQLDMERIFEPFFSNSDVGRGLGLSVVYGVVIGHDGFIKCSSDVGQRTSFRVLLPVSTEPIREHKPLIEDQLLSATECQVAAQMRQTQKILVIDDEETVLDLCAQLIQLNGWEVLTALGGEEGLRIATEFSDELSCILVDVLMPEMGGSELIREFDERGIQVPIVVMSGFSHTRLEFFLEKPNVVSIVEKPFRVNEIKQAVQNAIDFGPGLATNAELATGAAVYSNKTRQ